MSLFIAALNSGSNGNCYYVGNDKEAVLIDAGITCKEIEKRMLRLNLSLNTVKAVFISHEHSDHIFGVQTLSSKYNIPVYITTSTLQQSRLQIQSHLVRNFSTQQRIIIGNLIITAFSKLHDACDPHSFIVSDNEVSIGIFTDIGKPCQNVVYHFKQCHAAFLETNYDVDMLDKGRYPYFLKKRISGGNGHLSNEAALQLFLEHRSSYLSHLILSHLSRNNNKPEIAEQLFSSHAGETKIIVASRFCETEVFHIRHVQAAIKQSRHIYKPKPVQLSIFDF